MKKFTLAKRLTVAGLAVSAVSFVAAPSALAGYKDFYNRSDSHYAINVYETTNCSGTRHVVNPGSTYGNGQSYRVAAYSKFKVGSGSYNQVPYNVCVRVTSVDTTTVYVYSNN